MFINIDSRHPAAAIRTSYENMRSMMTRARNSVRPPIPGTLGDYGLTLGSAEWRAMYGQTSNGGTFFRHSIVTENTSNILFCSNEMLEILRTAKKLFIDATFRVTPNAPGCRQLLTLHVKFRKYVSIINMRKITQNTY